MKLDRPLILSFDDGAQTGVMETGVIPNVPDDTTNALIKKIDELERKLKAKERLLEEKRRDVNELLMQVEWLKGANEGLREHQKKLKEELYKAEFQVQLIDELVSKINE